jgi:hypothetical protein
MSTDSASDRFAPGKTLRATVTPLPPATDERRRKRRARVAQPVRVRPSEPIANDFDEVRATLNVCRDGIYFDTERDTYSKGMRLFITFPYHRDPNAINLEYIGQVVRLDRLPDGRQGVAVHLLMTINLKAGEEPGRRINYTSR